MTGNRSASNSRVIAALLVVIGVVLRIAYLSQPMRYDEAVTYMYFAARRWIVVFASYRYPNNHILHTALVKASTLLFGDAPWSIRLPAFAFGIMTVALTFAVGRRLVGVPAAWIGTAIVATSGPLILYSTNARGYSLVGAVTLCMLLLLLRLRERRSRIEWVAVSVAATVGMWAVPVMLYPAGGLALWFLWSALTGDTSEPRQDARRLVLAVAGTALLTTVVYAPVMLAGGLHPIVGNQFVTPTGWPAFARDIELAIPDLWDSWSTGTSRVVTAALFLLALVGAVLSRKRRARRVSLAGAMALWCVALLLITHRVPFVRVALFALPLVALLAGLGIDGLATLALRRANVQPSGVAGLLGIGAVGVATLLGASVVASGGVLDSRETGTLRDAQAIAEYLAGVLRPGDRVLAPVPSNAPLAYYFLRARMDASLLSAAPRPDGHVYLVVNRAEGFTTSTPLLAEPFMRGLNDTRLVRAFPDRKDSVAARSELYLLASRDGADPK